MNKRLFGAGVTLLLGGCASVEMAQYTVTSFPEVALKASEKKPANLKFVSSDDSLDYHLDPDRIRTDAEVETFAEVFKITVEDARRILKAAGRKYQS